jgi:hypothetical protein
LAVEDAAGVKFWDARDGGFGLGGVEVDYFLGCVFECCGWLEYRGGEEGMRGRTENDGVGWEDGEVGMEFLLLD